MATVWRRRRSSNPSLWATVVEEAGEDKTTIFGQEEDRTMKTTSPTLSPRKHNYFSNGNGMISVQTDADLPISQPQFCSPLRFARLSQI